MASVLKAQCARDFRVSIH